MDEVIIIDGYNIIHKWPDLKDLAGVSLEASRHKLEEIMVNYAAFAGHKVIIIYDGYAAAAGAGQPEDGEGLEVHFSHEETADTLIERMVFKRLRDKREGSHIYVATSDALEQSMIFSKGAYRLTPRELQQQIENTRQMMQDISSGEQKPWRLHAGLEHGIFTALEKIRRSN